MSTKSTTALRRSERIRIKNQTEALNWYPGNHEKSTENSEKEKSMIHGETRKNSFSKSKSTKSRAESIRTEIEQERKIAELEQKSFEKQEELLKIEKQQKMLERQKIIAEKEIQLNKLQMKKHFSEMSGSDYFEESDDGRKSSYVQNWVNSLDEVDGNVEITTERKESLEKTQIEKFMARQCLNRELQIFSGEPGQWLNFEFEFQESTKACGFSEAENILRLRKCLKGKARENVNALLNYTQEVSKIMSILKKQFGRPEKIIYDLIDNVSRIPDIKGIECVPFFANKILDLSITIQSLNCPQFLQNPQLLNELVRKLNPNLKLDWGRKIEKIKNEGGVVTILEFSNWLEEIKDIALNVEVHEIGKRKFVGSASIKNQEIKFKCKMCQKDTHKVSKCNEFLKMNIDQRWEWIRKNKLCFSCLGSSHSTKLCRVKKKCQIDFCTYYHHQLLHREKSQPQELCNVNVIEKKEVILRVAPVQIYGPICSLTIYALFDEGSTVTMLDSSIAEQIGLSGPNETLNIRWTNSSTHQDKSSEIVSFKIKGVAEKQKFDINARTVQNLSLPEQTLNAKSFEDNWKNIFNFEPNMLSYYGIQPKILIGQDNIKLIVPQEVHDLGKNAPLLSKCNLGWVLHGSLSRRFFQGSSIEYSGFVAYEDELLKNLVLRSFELENLGVKLCKKTENKEIKRAEQILENTTKRIGNKFESGLLWTENEVKLPNNKLMAKNRLLGITKKMSKNPQFAEQYRKKIVDYAEKNYARKLSKTEIDKKYDNVWYLPHFGVVNPNKPEKLRFVLDAAAKFSGVSLNDKLLKGPDLLNSLVGILMKFRQKKFAVTADIREMFHQIVIRKEDRQAQRFLWSNEKGEIEEYEMRVMIFGARSSPTTANYVMRKNALEFVDTFPEAVRAITELHYVDDYLESIDTEEEMKKRINDVIEIHRKGGFEIVNWTSNRKEILKSIPQNYRSCELKDMDLDKDELLLPTQRVLGLHWDPNEDKFYFKSKLTKEYIKTLETSTITKRKILQIVMSIFDPFGFLANYTIKARILLQEIWKMKLGWDDEIEGDILQKWTKWVQKLNKIFEVTVQRWYFNDFISNVKQVQLHTFCDASAQAYSAVSYFRTELNSQIFISFVMGKSKVAPLKPTTIPRLELQAALIACRVADTIRKNHDITIDKFFFWSDSQVVINWIKSDISVFKPFVTHRITEINETFDPEMWNWLPGNKNIADQATRENSCLNHHWLKGPEFLLSSEKEWLTWSNEIAGEIDDSEIEQTFVGVTQTDTPENLRLGLPEATRFSSWLKLIRTTAWMQRFIKNARNTRISGELTVNELESAEKLWLKVVQMENFEKEIKLLQNGKYVEKSSRLFTLSPILDENGIIRVKGRIINLNGVSVDARYPIILEEKNYFTRLLIKHFHKRANHQGQEYVLNELRQKYWVLNMRAAVRSSWNHCQWCKNKRSKPDIPEMAPLPSCRLNAHVRPFTITGMDYFGPLEVSVGRHKEKRYGVIFTCMSTRAVHLELAHSLTTDSAIMAIRRFIARRGSPTKIFSDNGTNLRGADNELKRALQELNQGQITTDLAKQKIEWHFIPPATPHMGGCWERLIKSVKRTLEVTLKERHPKEEVLLTLILEAEHIINSRPLVHVSLDHKDEEALTPNHFLLGSSSGAASPGKFDDNDLISRKTWKISQTLTDHFWKRWVSEYLPELTKRTKWYTPARRKIQIGDLVIIVDPNSPRNTWPRGVVTRTYPGKDGEIRVADVKTNMGVFKRPVVKLCVLDVN